MTPAAMNIPLDPAATLGKVRVGLREDLEVTRHVFRGEVSYVVRDPMTFQSQRLDAEDYEVFASVRADRSLADTFADLVRRRILAPDEQERFHQFILILHRLGFLRLPIADDKAVYRRYQARQENEAGQRLKSLLFLRIPIWNPNAFLDRTISLARFLFTRGFFLFWVCLVACAVYVGAVRWDDLRQPLDGVLVAQNLPLLWLTLVVLKVFHEFGHAYACKHYGGHVPEMGAYFILFTPCAYVDATACWGFTRKRERLIVCLAGMYVESILAAIAVFVWAVTEPSLVRSVAYNVIFLAGVVTILFNVNPLMRYDGYYILSDWLEIPNLRQRADRRIREIAKRWLLGIRPTDDDQPSRLRAILLVYGVAAFLYRLTLIFSIAAVLAGKVFLLGIVFAAVYLGGAVVGSIRRLSAYLWRSDETAPVRVRAALVGVLLLVALPAAFVALPVPSSVRAAGVVASANEIVLRAGAPGILVNVHAEPGAEVAADAPIAELHNDDATQAVEEHAARLLASSVRCDAYRALDPVKAAQEQAWMIVHRAALAFARDELERTILRSPAEGRLVSVVRDSAVGRFVNKGEPLGIVASGPTTVRAILTEEQLHRMAAAEGDPVEFRSATAPDHPVNGRIARIAPAGSRVVRLAPLTHAGGGDVAVDPLTHEANVPYFELIADLDAPASSALRHGATGTIRIAARGESLAQTLGRRFVRFWNQLHQ